MSKPRGPALDAMPGDPIAHRVRALRASRGLSLSELARRARESLARPTARSGSSQSSGSVSVSYLSLIENGHKVPDEAIAVALAEALEDDPAIYRAWVRMRKRSDVASAIVAAETLKRLLAEPGPDPSSAGQPVEAGSSSTRLRVPVIPAGMDPGDAMRPGCEIIAWRRLDPAALPPAFRGRVSRPFAYALTRDLARRASSFAGYSLAGAASHALVLREWFPLSAEPVYAVRSAGRVVLSRVLWNGRQLLLLPAPGDHDFQVLEAEDFSRLPVLILGMAVAVRFDPEGNSP